MSKKHKKACRVLNYINHSLTTICTITGCLSISPFPSLFDIPIEMTSSSTGLPICFITARIKKYKSMIKKKRKKHDKIVLLAKSKLSNIEVLISKTFIDSNICHAKFVLTSNALKEFFNMKKEIKNFINK